MFVRLNAYVNIWVTIIFNTLSRLVFHEDSESVVFSTWLYLHTMSFRIVMYHAYCIYFYGW